VTQSTNHIDDEGLSALVDNQVTLDEVAQVRAHLESCSACLERSHGLRSVAELLRRLPDVEPPRDFQLGPRLLVDPPNVIRLRRWYTATRVAAASLAAVFVFLSVGTLYVDSRPGVAPASIAADATQGQVLSAPAAAPRSAAPAVAVQQAPKPAAAAAPRQASPVPAAGVAAAARPAQAANPETDDQVAAATSVNPLPTPVPTPVPLARSVPVPAPQPAAPTDTAAPWRTSAAIAGVLAGLALLAALVARHRLQRQATHL
jgi:Putative zinc-finger